MKSPIKQIFVIILFTFLLSSCGTIPTQNPNDCIEENYSYSFKNYAYPDEKIIPTQIPLSGKWQPQLTQEQTRDIGNSVILRIVTQPDDTIWFRTMHAIVEYKTRSKELVIFDEEPLPYELFVDKYGNLWGTSLEEAATKNPDNNQPYFLAHFDKSTEKFEIVENDLLTGSGITYSEDSSGLLYFSTSDNRMLRFNPDSRKAELLDFNFPYYEVKSMTIDRKDNIWLSASFEESGIHGTTVLRYHPKDNSIENIGSVPGSSRYNAGEIFIDSSDRLWLQDYGYLDNALADAPSWYQVIRSPIFISDRGPVEFENIWADATPIFESKDHKLWFFSGAGLAYLDQTARKWCLLTSRITGVAEDSSNNLWIVDRGQIYKREKLY